MKKVMTICLLIVSILVGGMSIEAKTTKKKSKAKTSQTSNNGNSLAVETFLRKLKNPYSWYEYRNLSEIKTSLKKLGYSYIGEEDAGYYEFEDGEMEPMVTMGFQKGSTEVYVYKFEDKDWIIHIGIKFGSSTEKSRFINAAERKSKGNNLSVWQEDGLVFIGAAEN